MSQGALDQRFMALALSLGRRGLGQVSPWPSVGCVIVRGERIVGRGTSDLATRRHAEVVALAQAGDDARGATVYVTLEPCSHHGSTPPCADALVAARPSRVVVACQDPNPKVNGDGIARLRAAGIAVDVGLMADAARRDNAGFFSVVERGRPLMTLKLAASLDGRIATASGESRWITGAEARNRVHALRARHDAILVGGGTARADDPDLTVRGQGKVRQPARVVATRYLDLPQDGKLARTARQVPVWLLHGAGADTDAWNDLGVRTINVDAGPDRQLSPRAMLQALAKRGITRVLCEGGGALAASFLASDLVDELVVFHAGLALGAEGIPALGAMGHGRLAEAPRFDLVEVAAVGPDTMSVWRPRSA